MKKILVITATRGTRESLDRTVESVKSIGNHKVQHIIVAPVSAIPCLKQKYGKEIIYEPEPLDCNGIYPALNHGFKKYGRTYEYLTFINDDDYWLPQYGDLIETITNNDCCDFVYGKTTYVDANNHYIGEQTSSGFFKHFIPLLKSNIVLLTQQATIIRSSLYYEIGGFDESYKLVADTKFWALLSLKPIRYKYINKYCAAYTIQDGQLSSDHKTQIEEHQRLLKELPQYSHVSCSLSKTIYRLQNIKVYLKRFASGVMRNPLGKTQSVHI